MKNLFLFLTAFLINASVSIAQSDLVGPSSNLEATIDNIICPTGTSDLSFELTITDNGSPVTNPSSMTNSLNVTLQNQTPATVFNQFVTYTDPLENIPVNGTLVSPFTCDDIIGTNVTFSGQGVTMSFENFGGNNLGPQPDPIPTLGEWALIIMGILFINIALVSIRQSSVIID